MTLKALITKGEPTTELKPGNYSVKEPQPAAPANGEENNE
jgi:hypothetical protein